MKDNEIGVYIHIPFCQRKCFYCDFVSYEQKQDVIETYVNKVIDELEQNIEEVKDRNVTTIYFGGGTPSFINSQYVVRMMEFLTEKYHLDKKIEVTIEVNPGTVTKEKLEDYIKCGINRLSIGLQSTKNELLKKIGRIHTYEQFLNTYHLARSVGFQNINVDLMLALPNQSVEDLVITLEKVIELNPEHISLYSLILEEGTVLCEQIEKGIITIPEEREERQMYWKTKKRLEQNGYVHYEISNFSKAGYESKHNLNCWNQKEYIGIGVAAHSYFNLVRYSNAEQIEEYIKDHTKKIIHEKQNKNDQAKEFMMLGLRKIQGVKISDFKEKFIQNPVFLFHKELDKLVTKELVEVDDNNIKLTDRGLDFANLVWEEFI